MIGRRAVLGLVAGWSVSASAAPVPAGNRMLFYIMRRGSRIGEHELTFARSAGGLSVSVAVNIVVGLGPIALFRYKHQATVRWAGEEVVSVDAQTNDDGTNERMSARRDTSGLVVEGSKAPRYVAPPRSLPGTHWDRAMLDAPFINTQDGRLMSPVVTLVGTEKLDVTGGFVDAQHFTLRGDADLDTFYDASSNWVGLRFTAKDGSEVRYLRA